MVKALSLNIGEPGIMICCQHHQLSRQFTVQDICVARHSRVNMIRSNNRYDQQLYESFTFQAVL